ncbi:GDSL esterase/lipase [Smittium culicis]|uniref:GDSL esterase/lipase n=1 Tax=Smittium culicis TaxID=133412 RepID=A0A1R1X1I5_9FUNG|nr:GDSL esterase/lipase [Smittium culicis]
MFTYDGYMNDVIIAFGDSITELGQDPRMNGWVSQLSNYYIRKLEVINRGYSGYNTENGWSVFSRMFPKSRDDVGCERMKFSSTERYKTAENLDKRVELEIGTSESNRARTKLVIIFLGTNDASFPVVSQHVSLENFEANIHKMISLLSDPSSDRYSRGTRILLISPPPISESIFKKFLAENGFHIKFKSNDLTKEYSDKIVEIGKQRGIPTIDTWTSFMKEISSIREKKFGNPNLDNLSEQSYDDASYGFEELLLDGLHLSKKGNDKVFKMILDKINECIPELRSDNLGDFMPDPIQIIR